MMRIFHVVSHIGDDGIKPVGYTKAAYVQNQLPDGEQSVPHHPQGLHGSASPLTCDPWAHSWETQI